MNRRKIKTKTKLLSGPFLTRWVTAGHEIESEDEVSKKGESE